MISKNLGFNMILSVVMFSTTVFGNPCEGLDLEFVNDYTSCSNYFSCLKGVAFPKVLNIMQIKIRHIEMFSSRPAQMDVGFTEILQVATYLKQ